MADAPGANRAWGKARIEALSDGVFAIALTLLVLDIRLPEVARSLPNREILRALRSLGPSFLSFVITFVLG
ncbi:MAG TPA: TMEM175 family protein, partial [Vicinamibacterales bacterium]